MTQQDLAADSVLIDRYSTRALAPRDRHEAWCARSPAARVYETRPLQPFMVDAEHLQLDELSVYFSDISAQRFERTRRMAARDGVDMITVSVRFGGGAAGDADGVSVRASGGTVILADLAKPFSHVSEACSNAYVVLPRVIANDLLPDDGSRHGRVIAAKDALLLRQHLAQLRERAPDLPASQGARLARTVYDLICVVASRDATLRDVSEASAATARLIRAKNEIEARLESPELTVAHLSRSLGISRSQLYRLFADSEGVQAYIRNRRLERIAATLREDDAAERIADLADRFGFCDTAHLGRAFRARFGMAPAEFRDAERRR